MSLNLGSLTAASLKVGANSVSKLYKGNTQVWSAAPSYTTELLLHFDGINGSTNFIDSSPNGLTVTANGNAAISTAQSRFGGASCYFDGTTDIGCPYNPLFDFGTGDFTIEFWVYSLDNTTQYGIICGGTYPLGWNMYLGDNCGIGFASGAGGWSGYCFGSNPSPNQWHHIALVRNNGTMKAYLDGIFVGETDQWNGADINSGGGPFSVGFVYNGEAWSGYIDELRIIKGYAAYTTNFTPPTLPFGAEVSLLLHMDGSNGSTSFVDSSSNALTVMANGNAQISTAESRFGGASGYFDFSGGTYLTLPGTETDPRFQFGSGDFTIEAWVWFSSGVSENVYAIYAKLCPCAASEANTNISFGIQLLNNELYMFATACGPDIPSGGFWHNTLLPAGATDSWHHAAWVRSGDNFTLYWDGVALGTQAATGTLYSGYNYPVIVGGWGTGGQRFSGYIDELRVIKGYAAYTTNFTPPDLPFGAEVSLLLHMDGADGSTSFTDSSANALSLTANGNAVISTTESRFGGASGYFYGGKVTGAPLSLGAGDFTVECWVLIENLNNYFNQFCGQHFPGAGADWLFGAFSDGRIYIQAGSGQLITSPLMSADGQWHHVAMVKLAGNGYFFLDGVQYSAGAWSGAVPSAFPLAIGGANDGPNAFGFNGYIDELRIVKGYAAYTSNFNPPELPFGAQVSLLLHMDGSNGSTTFTDSSENALTVTANGNAAISTTESRFGGAALYLPSNRGNLSLPYADALSFGAGDFTMDLWLYLLPDTGEYGRILSTDNTCNNSPYLWDIYSPSRNSHSVGFGRDCVGYDISYEHSIQFNQWNHLAVSRQGDTLRLFENGVVKATATVPSGAQYNCDPALIIGGSLNQWAPVSINGYIDELRIIKGYAAYTSNFTPPDLPFGSQVSLLLHMDGSNGSTSFIDTSPNGLTVTPNGNAAISTAESRFGGASGYFDGDSNSFLTIPYSSNFTYGTEDFTLEAWVYLTDLSGVNIIYSQSASGANYFVLAHENGLVEFLFNYNNPGMYVYGSTLSVNSWNHVAVCRKDGVFTVYVNGVGGTPVADSFNFDNTTYNPTIGSYGHNLNYNFNGYIDELRIIKGYAAYTSNFTPPTLPFGAEVSLLLHMDGTNGSTSFTDSSPNALTVTANGNAAISTTESRFGGASGYFDGSSGWLQASNACGALGSDDFTVECWVKTDGNSYNQAAAGVVGNMSAGYEFQSWRLTVGDAAYQHFGWWYHDGNWQTVDFGVINICDNVWHHVAVCRKTNTLYGFVDGSLVGTINAEGLSFSSGGPLHVAYQTVDNTYYVGYIDELRIIKGYAAYTTNFTPPESAFS